MATSILEKIAANLATVLDEISGAVIVRPKRRDWFGSTAGDWTVFVWQADDDPIERSSQKIRYRQTFELYIVTLPDDDAAASIDTTLNDRRATVEQKLKEDRTRGGNADDTILMGARKFSGGPSGVEFTGVMVQIGVEYKVSETNPYSL